MRKKRILVSKVKWLDSPPQLPSLLGHRPGRGRRATLMLVDGEDPTFDRRRT